MISPSILFCRTSASLVSIRTYPPRLIQIVLRKRDGSSTRTVFWSGREHEYRLLPSALITRAMTWDIVKDDGGVEVSSAAAKTLRFGRPIFDLLLVDLSLQSKMLDFAVVKITRGLAKGARYLIFNEYFVSLGKFTEGLRRLGETFCRSSAGGVQYHRTASLSEQVSRVYDSKDENQRQ
jgi:hypothetical protein